MNKTSIGMAALMLSGTLFVAACDDSNQEAVEVAFEGDVLGSELAPMATLRPGEGLRFASEEVARAWTQEAPGVWRHQDSTGRLIVGGEGHQWAAERLEIELAGLYEQGAPESELAAREAQLAAHKEVAAQADDKASLAASCDISTYNGPSSPYTGFIGGAALAQISCVNGTVIFTVETQVCTGTSGCGPVSRQTAIPDAFPRIWGTARSGYGSCWSYVYLTPSGIFDSYSYTCN
jgi:hypothetical protein